jgi:hypothetical protein
MNRERFKKIMGRPPIYEFQDSRVYSAREQRSLTQEERDTLSSFPRDTIRSPRSMDFILDFLGGDGVAIVYSGDRDTRLIQQPGMECICLNPFTRIMSLKYKGKEYALYPLEISDWRIE